MGREEPGIGSGTTYEEGRARAEDLIYDNSSSLLGAVANLFALIQLYNRNTGREVPIPVQFGGTK